MIQDSSLQTPKNETGALSQDRFFGREEEKARRRVIGLKENERLVALHQTMWSMVNGDPLDERCRDGVRLSRDDWEWLKALATETRIDIYVAQGMETPNPFVLSFLDGDDELMIHPTQVPESLGSDLGFILAEFRSMRDL